MTDYIIFRTILDFGLLFFGLWAIATRTVQRMFMNMKRKSRPRRGTPKRQGKFYNIIVTDGEEGRK